MVDDASADGTGAVWGLAQLSAGHSRLLPPNADPAAGPVWSDDLPEAALDGIGRAGHGRAAADGRRKAAQQRPVLGGRYGVFLVHPRRTSNGSLAVRLASGLRAAVGIASRSLRRLLLALR
ncbi:hypothetical protein QCN29_22485 [Streptomyces sp. HNM0663]|uniref:Uncharacterized protein n=1 Tax=Streptomyces chengmaiensis TaxID=3040919 RepID=A0ABT6HT07_9ACTN|nr:hypothetical protein [Streptomyces chengmaiensis]MDH2391495.1 hypothetical protein [Streptomyces chengmaiensis]